MKRRLLSKVLLVLALTTVPFVAGLSAHAQAATATVTVLHALPGFTADVYVNGDLTLSGFEPQTATDPLELPAGRYRIEIFDVGADPTSEPALAGTVRLTAGQNLSIIAGLTEEGDPELNVFPNSLARVPPGRTRLVVRNVADVASIGVRLDGERVFGRVPHGAEKAAFLEAGGPHPLEATVSGEVAIDVEDFILEEGTVGIVYAVGSSGQGTLDFMYQTIRGLQSSPGSVLTGNGGLATPPGLPAWALPTMILAGLCLASAIVLARRT